MDLRVAQLDKEACMRRYLASTFVAIGCASLLTVNMTAQTTESKTKVEAEHAKPISYTGCIQTGTETRTFVLNNVVPVSKTETVGTSGTMSATTYALIPEGTVQLQQHVGQKVEVQAVLIEPGKGDAKVETKTKTAEGTEQKTKTEIERGPLPQLKVISVKQLAESCTP